MDANWTRPFLYVKGFSLNKLLQSKKTYVRDLFSAQKRV